MKKILFTLLCCVHLNAIFGQSFLKISTNKSYFNDYYPEQAKFGFGLGVQTHVFKHKWMKLILEEDIDFRRINFSYYRGGLGGGTTTSGTIKFSNLKINARTRLGKRFFGDLGIFSAYSLGKKITSGQVYEGNGCTIILPATTCTGYSMTKRITNEAKEFSNFDWGFLIGTGFTWKKITVELDFQGGKNTIVNARYFDYHTRQLNLSLVLPLSNTTFKK
jgi:hypothetical protein